MKKSIKKIKRPYQQCTRCVMDTSDPNITFNEDGLCSYCQNYDKNIKPFWHPDENRFDELEKIAEKIRKEGEGRDYDCILGLSGGADSSYLAYIAKEVMHLRPLALVIDTGWNLNVAVENIERIVKGLDIDMWTVVINWKEMADLQLAMFKAQVSGQDLVQDHAIFAGLYNYAVQHHIKYVLTGSNSSTEFIRPPIEFIPMNDLRSMRDIDKKFGTIPLKTYPQCDIFKYRLLYRYVYGMKRIYPLDYVIYNKEEAMKLLHEKYGWESYANKHYENVFTRWYEGYYLPHKFGYDTRRNVLSNQILAGTMTREEANRILAQPPYDPEQMEEDKEYIAKKLGVSTEEFERIIEGENKTIYDYKNEQVLIHMAVKIAKLAGVEKRNV